MFLNTGSGTETDDPHFDLDESITADYKDFVANENLFEQPLFNDLQIQFNLQAPALVSTYLNIHYVCETGSRILFLSVYWMRKIAAFEQLDERTQCKLIRAHWPALLVVALAQASNISLSTIISTLIGNIRQLSEIDKIEPSKIRRLSEHTSRLHEFVQEMQTLDVSDQEYAYLRLALVFNPQVLIRNRERSVRAFVKRIQLYALESLRQHILQQSCGNDAKIGSTIEKVAEERYNSLLLSLMPLSALESEIIEELFFANLVGQLQIDNMMQYILTLSGNA